MANDTIRPPSISRRVAAAAAGLMIVSAGVVAVVRGKAQNDNILYQFERPLKGGNQSNSGATVGYVTSSGALAMSGAGLFSDGKTGSGAVKIAGSDGGRVCVNDIDGTGCSCIAANNGVVQSWVGIGAECP